MSGGVGCWIAVMGKFGKDSYQHGPMVGSEESEVSIPTTCKIKVVLCWVVDVL